MVHCVQPIFVPEERILPTNPLLLANYAMDSHPRTDVSVILCQD